MLKALVLFLLPLAAWGQSDNFNRADGQPGSNWTLATGKWSISGNRLRADSAIDNTLPAGWLILHYSGPYADAFVQAKLWRPPVSDRTIAMVLRYTNSGGNLSYYTGWIRKRAGLPDEWRILRYNGTARAGVYTTLATAYANYTDGASVQFQAQGTALGLSIWNGSAWTLVASATDSQLTSGSVGFRANDQQAYMDDFLVSGSSGSGPAPGGGFLTPARTVITDSSGFLTTATGTVTDCVHVDGTSGTCGSGGGGGRAEQSFSLGATTVTATLSSGTAADGGCYLGTGPSYTPFLPNSLTLSGAAGTFAFSATPSAGKCVVVGGGNSGNEATFATNATTVTVTHGLGTVVATSCYLGSAPTFTPFFVNGVTLNSNSTIFNFSAAPSGGKCVVQ
jgi:hypothetical protein